MTLKSQKRPNIKDGSIFFDRYPPDHARHAFDNGYYVEALQVLHLWLEAKLQEWLLLSRHKNKRGSYEEVWNTANDISFLQAAKALYVTGKMPKSTFDAARKFNAMRNKVMHRLFKETYDEGLISIPFKEYETAFTTGLKLSGKLEGHLAKLATRGKVGNGK